jgi:hypothetical protein
MSEARAADKRTQFERTEQMSTKTQMTVTDALNSDRIAKQYNDALLAAAMEINDDASQRVIRANADLAACDRDNENGFALCVEMLYLAEEAFIGRHENTVVSL